MKSTPLRIQDVQVPTWPAHGEPQPSTFSRPSHFAFLLSPVLLGVSVTLLQDQTHSIGYRLGIVALLTATLSMAIAILSLIRKSEDA